MIPFIVLFVTGLVAVGQLNAQTLDVSGKIHTILY